MSHQEVLGNTGTNCHLYLYSKQVQVKAGNKSWAADNNLISLLSPQLIINFEETFHRQMKWINDTVGGTRDKLSVISVLLGHIVHFCILLVAMMFTGSSLLSRIALLMLLPLNCVFALQNKRHFTHKELASIVALTYPGITYHTLHCTVKTVFQKITLHVTEQLLSLHGRKTDFFVNFFHNFTLTLLQFHELHKQSHTLVQNSRQGKILICGTRD